MQCGGDPAAAELCRALEATDAESVLRLDDNGGDDALPELVTFRPDFVLIRADTPAGHPWDGQWLLDFAAFGHRPVIALLTEDELRRSGRPDWSDRVLVAPYTRGSLHRVAQLLRVGTPQLAEGPVVRYSCGDVELNEDAHTVQVAGRAVALTFVEFEVLSALLRHKERAVSYRELAPHLAGGPRSSANAARVYVRRVRAKLAEGQGFTIETVQKVGYRIVGRKSARIPD